MDSTSSIGNRELTREEKLAIYKAEKSEKKNAEKFNEIRALKKKMGRVDFQGSLRNYDQETFDFGDDNGYSSMYLKDSQSNSELNQSVLGSVTKSQISREKSFTSKASVIGSNRKEILSKIENLDLDGKRKAQLRHQIGDSKKDLLLEFNDKVAQNPSLSVSKCSYSGFGDAKENIASRKIAPNKIPPRQKLSLDKDYLASEHPVRNTRNYLKDFQFITVKDRLDSPSLMSGHHQGARKNPIDQQSIQKSDAISINSRNTEKTVQSKVSKHSVLSLGLISSNKKLISKFRDTPNQASAKKIKLLQQSKRSLTSQAQEIYELYKSQNPRWEAMFDRLCKEELGKLYESAQEKPLYPDKLKRDVFPTERLFFNNYQLLIMFFIRHRAKYQTIEEVEQFFSFNLVSSQIQEFKQEYLISRFPEYVNSAEVEAIQDGNLGENQLAVNKITSTARQAVTRKMAFPPKYQDINLIDDLTMEEDFTLAEKDTDPFSRMKVDKFRSLYTESQAQEVSNARVTCDLNMDIPVEFDHHANVFNNKDFLFKQDIDEQIDERSVRVERQMEDEFDDILRDVESDPEDQEFFSYAPTLKPAAKSILKNPKNQVQFLLQELEKEDAVPEKANILERLSTLTRQARKNQERKIFPSMLNPVMELLIEGDEDQSIFLLGKREISQLEEDVTITDPTCKKLKPVDIYPDNFNSDEDSEFDDPLVVKLPNPYALGFDFEFQKLRARRDEEEKMKLFSLKMIESVEEMNVPFDELPIDGTCYFQYTLVPAPKEIKQDFGLS